MDITIISSCSGYGKYLSDWADSIARLTVKPTAVCLFTHGSEEERRLGAQAIEKCRAAQIAVKHDHDPRKLDYGSARNRAVSMSETEWVMHLDSDDTIMPHALLDVEAIAPNADVVAMGYERNGNLHEGPNNRRRIYSDTTGLQALQAMAPASGVSPFRRSFWEQRPYRTDMLGAWDTALWIGFARLGARFRATKRPCFWYRQHADSIFNQRRRKADWTQRVTELQLQGLRRDYSGVDVLVPRCQNPDADRIAAWSFVRRHYAKHHPDWRIIEGLCSSDEWRKGEAIAQALSQSTASVIVVADADVIVSPESLREAVELVQNQKAPWVVPHTQVLRLDADSTGQYFATWQIPPNPTFTRAPYKGFAGGGIFVAPRSQFEASGGIPSAFKGWGAEDEALAAILDCLLGRHVRLPADLIHFWHEPQPSKAAAREVFSTGNNNRQLFRQIARSAKAGQKALWQTLKDLERTEKRARRIKTEAEIEARRRSQSFLVRQGRRGKELPAA